MVDTDYPQSAPLCAAVSDPAPPNIESLLEQVNAFNGSPPFSLSTIALNLCQLLASDALPLHTDIETKLQQLASDSLARRKRRRLVESSQTSDNDEEGEGRSDSELQSQPQTQLQADLEDLHADEEAVALGVAHPSAERMAQLIAADVDAAAQFLGPKTISFHAPTNIVHIFLDTGFIDRDQADILGVIPFVPIKVSLNFERCGGEYRSGTRIPGYNVEPQVTPEKKPGLDLQTKKFARIRFQLMQCLCRFLESHWSTESAERAAKMTLRSLAGVMREKKVPARRWRGHGDVEEEGDDVIADDAESDEAVVRTNVPKTAKSLKAPSRKATDEDFARLVEMGFESELIAFALQIYDNEYVRGNDNMHFDNLPLHLPLYA